MEWEVGGGEQKDKPESSAHDSLFMEYLHHDIQYKKQNKW